MESFAIKREFLDEVRSLNSISEYDVIYHFLGLVNTQGVVDESIDTLQRTLDIDPTELEKDVQALVDRGYLERTDEGYRLNFDKALTQQKAGPVLKN